MRVLVIGLLWALTMVSASAPTVITVGAGGDLQAAINLAQPGDTVVVEAGATFRGPLVLPVKAGATTIVVQSSRAGELPAGRVGPAQAALMPKLIAPNAEQAIRTVAGAHHWKFDGFEIFQDAAATTTYELVRFGEGRQAQATLASVPHHLTIDRSYIHGSATQNSQRGVTVNCAECSVTNSYISDIHTVGIEAQAIGGWNGPGPIHVINDYLEAAGENIMFGGADSAAPELMPADIEIRRNYLFKPLSWNPAHPTYAGRHWTVKNVLELKAAKRVVIDGNVLENSWVDAQTGIPVLFTVRNQECSANWSTVQDVTFTNNTVKNAPGALNLLGKDNEAEPSYGKCPAGSTSTRGTNATVSNNLFTAISGPFLQLNGFYNVTLSNNTSQQANNLMTLYGEQSLGLKFLNHLTEDHDYGIFGDGGTIGTAAFQKYAPDAVMSGCEIHKPYGAYPAGNQYPATPLVLPPDFRSPTAGVGADIDALNTAQGGGGTTLPTPSPTPTVAPSPSPSPTPLPSPSPSPSPSPMPTPTRTPYEAAKFTWPSNQAARDALLNQVGSQGYGSCFVTGSYLYCMRQK